MTLDEGRIEILGEERRTAGWIAAPVGGELIRRTAPLLGLRPESVPGPSAGVRQARNGNG